MHAFEGPIFTGPIFEGPVFERPAFESPASEGPVSERPASEGPALTAADQSPEAGREIYVTVREAGIREAGVKEPGVSEAGASAAAGGKAASELRRAKRQQVLKRAQLVMGFSGSTIDCLIMDETPFGVLVETPVMTNVPEHVKIRFIGGGTFEALKRWSSGTKIGLEFIGAQIHDATTLRQRLMIDGVLKKQGLHAAVFLLREERFFDNAELRSASEAAEIALARLESLLV